MLFCNIIKTSVRQWDIHHLTSDYHLKSENCVSALSCSAQHLVRELLGVGRDLLVGSGVVAPCGQLSVTIAIHFSRERPCCCVAVLTLPPATAAPMAASTPGPGPPATPCNGRAALLASRGVFSFVCGAFLCSTSHNLGLEYCFSWLLVKVIRNK